MGAKNGKVPKRNKFLKGYHCAMLSGEFCLVESAEFCLLKLGLNRANCCRKEKIKKQTRKMSHCFREGL